MEQHLIRRLRVLDEQQPVRMISEADLATNLPGEKVAEYCKTLYSAPAETCGVAADLIAPEAVAMRVVIGVLVAT